MQWNLSPGGNWWWGSPWLRFSFLWGKIRKTLYIRPALPALGIPSRVILEDHPVFWLKHLPPTRCWIFCCMTSSTRLCTWGFFFLKKRSTYFLMYLKGRVWEQDSSVNSTLQLPAAARRSPEPGTASVSYMGGRVPSTILPCLPRSMSRGLAQKRSSWDLNHYSHVGYWCFKQWLNLSHYNASACFVFCFFRFA